MSCRDNRLQRHRRSRAGVRWVSRADIATTVGRQDHTDKSRFGTKRGRFGTAWCHCPTARVPADAAPSPACVTRPLAASGEPCPRESAHDSSRIRPPYGRWTRHFVPGSISRAPHSLTSDPAAPPSRNHGEVPLERWWSGAGAASQGRPMLWRATPRRFATPAPLRVTERAVPAWRPTVGGRRRHSRSARGSAPGGQSRLQELRLHDAARHRDGGGGGRGAGASARPHARHTEQRLRAARRIADAWRDIAITARDERCPAI